MAKKYKAIILSLLFSIPLFAQNAVTMPKLKIYLWSFLENEPSLELKVDYPEEEFYTYAIRQLKKIAPYVFEGMIFGYNFDYTPYDKTRNVSEFFEVQFNNKDFIANSEIGKNIKFTDPKIEDNILHCWAEIQLTEDLNNRIIRNQSVIVKKIHGIGNGKLKDQEQGIYQAFENAIKDAVRNYARSITKNKPSEITGKVYISKEPRIYIKHGQYYADIEFYLEDLKIYAYESF